MRITNNIHNVAVLDVAEITYFYMDEEKVAVGGLDKKGN
jgi:hypothetical protein